MRLELLPDNPGPGIVLVEFLTEDENYKYIKRNFSSKNQFDNSEAVVAKVISLGRETDKYGLSVGDYILLYTKSLLQPRFIKHQGKIYYLVHLANSFIASYSKPKK